MKVCIEKDEQGQFTVGIDQPDQEAGQEASMGPRMMAGGEPVEGQEDAGMQPVADIEAALSTARDLLTNSQVPDQGPPTGPAADNMWNRAKAARQMAKQPGGPMMGKMG